MERLALYYYESYAASLQHVGADEPQIQVDMDFCIMLQAFPSIQLWLRSLEEPQRKEKLHLCI